MVAHANQKPETLTPQTPRDANTAGDLGEGKNPKTSLIFETIENVGSLGLSKYSWACGGGFGR